MANYGCCAPGYGRRRLGRKRIVNDMSIQVATVNGSGSQSSNTVLLRSIFQMGVPVSGKNLFPSNIAGLPTWCIRFAPIRTATSGAKKEIDFLVAMNAENRAGRCDAAGAGRFPVLYDELPRARQTAQRSDFLRGPVRQDRGSGLPGSQAAHQAGQETWCMWAWSRSCSKLKWGKLKRRFANSLQRKSESRDLEPSGRRRRDSITQNPKPSRSAASSTSSA